jgi:transposase
MDAGTLFELPQAMEAPARVPTRPEEARVNRAVRQQIEWMPRDLEAVVPEDHPARAIMNLLDRLDLSAFYGKIKAVLDHPGRPATDPQVLLGLWLLATAEGIGSARRLARLCEEHDAYRWLCGGVPINYHMLADFRVANSVALNELLTEILASLMNARLVTLQEVAQDGLRVRASAGASSFRGHDRLRQCLEAARGQVQRLERERDQPDPTESRKRERARERAARERLERVEQALTDLPAIQAIKEQVAKRRGRHTPVGDARASTTDPNARVMRMGDGGFHPAYNVQLATDVASGVIVGVAVTNQGSDSGLALPMERQIVERTHRHPNSYLMDGGFIHRNDITTLERHGIRVYAPERPTRRTDGTRAPLQHRASPEVRAWHERMATPEAKQIYRKRAASAEWVNAQFRERHGLTKFRVRGLDKVLSVSLLLCITHNLLRWLALA